MIIQGVRNKFAFAAVTVSFSFLLANLFLFPLYNSGDDVQLLYLLSGGYNMPPTHLLHYNFGWHPALGWIVRSFFSIVPAVNWYTVFLLSLQGVGFIVVLYCLLGRFRWSISLTIYGLLFLFIEVRNIISLNFTATAWVLTVGGLMLLLDDSSRPYRTSRLLLVCLILITAGLLRLHAMAGPVLLTLPLFIIHAAKNYRVWLSVFLFVLILIFSLSLLHQHFYRSAIPGWNEQEHIRQSLIYSYNRPIDRQKPWTKIFRDSSEMAYYRGHFYYDSNVLNPIRVAAISKSLTRYRNFDRKEDFQVIYWLFIGSRVYILLLVVSFIIFWQLGFLKQVLYLFVWPAAAVALTYLILVVFFKITNAIHLGLQLQIFLSLVYSVPPGRLNKVFGGKKSQIYLLLILVPLVWIGIRIFKDNGQNRRLYQNSACVFRELKRNPDKLFVDIGYTLPLGHYYIWNTPENNKLTNLIILGGSISVNRAILRRYEIEDIYLSLYSDKEVFFVGNVPPIITLIYRLRYNLEVEISSIEEEYGCLNARKIRSSH